MLEAERVALKWEAYHASLDIVEREMGVLLQFFTNVGTIGALLAGFIWNTLSNEFWPEHMSEAAEICFTGCVCVAFGSMVFSVFSAIVTQTLGPTMALKGKDGTAMRKAVEHMKVERWRVLVGISIGMLGFAVAFLILLWHKVEFTASAILGTAVWAVMLVTLVVSVRSTAMNFAVPEASPMVGAGVVRGEEYLRKAGQTAPAAATAAPSRIAVRSGSATTRCSHTLSSGSPGSPSSY
uniref:H(+)-exporting diphosphatase n=1 Tax=Prymnesium polylepis TaxID=72548 RepID=A0A7S4IW53_9EUKA|mmetsp:Transcript_35634/g.89419  ORF Transcript_35634/g.89419 Transcript_35634/m.89419 type:complete len:238 (+) Transcript_35634:65-778(+)